MDVHVPQRMHANDFSSSTTSRLTFEFVQYLSMLALLMMARVHELHGRYLKHFILVAVSTRVVPHLAAAAAVAASRFLTCFITFSMRQICLIVILGAWHARRGRGVQRGPRYVNRDR